jgi:hypothetical protein
MDSRSLQQGWGRRKNQQDAHEDHSGTEPAIEEDRGHQERHSQSHKETRSVGDIVTEQLVLLEYLGNPAREVITSVKEDGVSKL